MTSPVQVDAATKAAVLAFLAAFVAAGLAGAELWPLTGWKLFSQRRAAVQVGWQAVTVDAAGAEEPVPFGRLPRGYGGGLHVMAGMSRLPAGERRAVCRTWGRAAAGLGAEVAGVRVYRTRTAVRTGSVVDRRLVHECAPS